MWDTRRHTWTVAAWFAVFLVGAAGLRGQAADEDLLGIERGKAPPPVERPAPKCTDCGGKREVTCPECQATGKVARPCGACAGTRKVACPSEGCTGGQKRCKRCGGTGQQPSIGPKGAGFSPCAPTIRCDLCSATGRVDCKKCRKLKGSSLEPCPTCQGKKMLPCTLCQVDDATGLAPAPSEVEVFDPQAAQVATQVSRLEALLRKLAGLLDRIDPVTGQAQRLLDRFADDDNTMTALGLKAAAPKALQDLRGLLDDRWERCREGGAEVRLFHAKLPGLQKGARLLHRDLQAKVEKLAAQPRAPVDELWLGEQEGAVATDVGKLEAGEESCTQLGAQLDRFEKELDVYRRGGKEEAEKESRNAAETRVKEATFLRIKRAAGSLARRHGFPEATCQLLPSKSALDLEVELVLLDPEATFDGEEALPSEATLIRLVPLVTDLYQGSPELVRLRIRLDGSGLSETGMPVASEVQRFAAERGRWNELTSGAFSEQPLEILSRCRPTPPYPRPQPGMSREAWPIIALVALLFGAVCLVFVARTRMLS